jgi:hypothetical protein
MTEPQDVDSQDALDRIFAEAAISRVLVAYCQGVDRRDWEQVLACYHDDAVDSHGEFKGAPRDLVASMRRDHEHVSFCMHVLSNISIIFSAEDASLARVESYCVSRKTIEAAERDPYLRASGATGPVRRTVACRYVDTFEKRPDVGWRIAARTVVHEWMRRDPQDAFIPFAEAIATSRRDRTDLLYSPTVRSSNPAPPGTFAPTTPPGR